MWRRDAMAISISATGMATHACIAFRLTGKHITSWGQPGTGPGQFNLPHAIAVDSGGRVYVADRENSRVQIFSADGVFLKSWDWVGRPNDIFIDDQDFIHIAELGWSKPVPYHVHDKACQCPPAGHDPGVARHGLRSGRQGRRAVRRSAIQSCRATSSPRTGSGAIRAVISMSGRLSCAAVRSPCLRR